MMPFSAGQGCVTSTVLTNRSKYLTIIDDNKPTGLRDIPRRKQQQNYCPKGARKMHSSTLTLGQEFSSERNCSTTSDVR